tara:strand:+ start:567 stop:686 length:120 start_codon:yes stop_codon:yes gene_type:complete
MPPVLLDASNTIGLCPNSHKRAAAESPAEPAPIITIFVI